MVVKKLLPIKSHYFFFMAALGPILPQLSVYGKELGVSSVVMGTITGILPIAFMFAKPLFGVIFDVFRNYRKAIFIGLLLTMSGSFALIHFLPVHNSVQRDYTDVRILGLERCNQTDEFNCESMTELRCSCTNTTSLPNTAGINSITLRLHLLGNQSELTRCVSESSITDSADDFRCNLTCLENLEASNQCLYHSLTFWMFVAMLTLGSIAFNVVNSISDAVCFAVIGEKYDYGQQRVWGTIGFGVTALIAGYIVDLMSDVNFSYTPAFIVMLIFTAFDLISCTKLDLTIMETPKNIFREVRKLINNTRTITFISFAVFAGIMDGFIIYFLFWYLEDLAIASNTSNIKLIEGVIVAAETLGGEVLFFSIAGKILEKAGHAWTFAACFASYALRLGLISMIPSPWWALPVEFFLQGPTYALTYTTIVEYANAIAPKGATATMQGIAAGMDDGFGYAIGSAVGGLLYQNIGGVNTFRVLAMFATICSISYILIHKCFLHSASSNIGDKVSYSSPPEQNKP